MLNFLQSPEVKSRGAQGAKASLRFGSDLICNFSSIMSERSDYEIHKDILSNYFLSNLMLWD
jgi:hypothetical protein